MDKVVVKTGKIFQAGDYPDKKFKVEPKELSEIVNKFTGPVPLDLNHKTTIKRLDSKLGKLTKVWQGPDNWLMGDVEIPEWFNNVVCKDDDGKDLPLPVSCAFGKDKNIVKLALTDTPRVSDAAIFAAFSEAHPEEAKELKEELTEIGVGELADTKFSNELVKELVEFAKKSNSKTYEGQSVIQQVHDTLARAGAVCYPTTDLHSANELSSIQTAHDEMMAAGAECRMFKDGEKPVWFSSELSEQPTDVKTKEKKMDSEKLSLVQSILKFIDGDSGVPAETGKPEKEAVFNKAAAAPAKEEPKTETEFASPEVTALRAELEDEKKKTAKLIADGIAAQSKILANEVIAGKHAQEGERAKIEAAFSRALEDDQANPVEIQFSADSKGSRVDLVKSMYSAKTIVPLTEEQVDEKETETLLSDDKAGQEDATKKRLEAVRERAVKLAERKNASQRRAK